MAALDPATIAVLALAVLFLAWYYAGFAYNRKLARRLANELKTAVLAFGGTSRAQWYGTTAFKMMTEGANPPFREVSLTVTLRPREMPINWAIGAAQGRRDTVLVEAALRKDPGTHFEVVDPQSRVGRRRLRAKSGWSSITQGDRSLQLSADSERKATRILDELGPDALGPIMALHVTSGSQPGLAASLAVDVDSVKSAIEGIRSLANRLAAQ